MNRHRNNEFPYKNQNSRDYYKAMIKINKFIFKVQDITKDYIANYNPGIVIDYCDIKCDFVLITNISNNNKLLNYVEMDFITQIGKSIINLIGFEITINDDHINIERCNLNKQLIDYTEIKDFKNRVKSIFKETINNKK